MTAYINLNGMKQAVLAELRRSVRRRATITVLGDRWVLGSRTGAQQVFSDVETLADALVDQHLVDRRLLPDDGGAEFERILAAGTHSAPPLDAGRLVRALLLSADTV
ncbi:hypothetical protein [Kocuria sp. UCD-OTCP]|uniref:hypothetical protein n=1 Tax=Kocuria sp. UCD-OTCP TaxID=1292021 RepID=UPI000377FA88|nr:hypothetical protein [Kocuria sp. UCD-OTCP]EYT54036.1 hypothetical protein H488_0104820 [Kocuria sp. UCD-OTCP]